MWVRKELKVKAKAVLRKNYWKAFLVSIVIALIGGGSSGGGGASNNNSRRTIMSNNNIHSSFILIIFTVIVVIILIAALRIFLGYPLEVGGRKYFVQSALYMDNKKCFRF